MREVAVSDIQAAVKSLYLTACCEIAPDALAAVRAALTAERSPVGREILRQILENAALASAEAMPACQDTGMAVVFLDVGQGVCLTGGPLAEAVDAGVRAARAEGCLRASVLWPLSRRNTGDNTPAALHTRIVPGDAVDIAVMAKGFGSENMSRLGMLMPAQGARGVADFVVETVREAGANPCPPMIIGVGIGGTAEGAMLLAKRQLLRSLGEPAPDAEMAELERALLARINALGIGPQGLGGDTTALGVLCAQQPTHIAGLPVAVNVQCHAARHRHVRL